MKKIPLIATFIGVALVLASPVAEAKAKKTASTKKTMDAQAPLPPRLMIYDADRPKAPAMVLLNGAPEAQVPDAPLMIVTSTKSKANDDEDVKVEEKAPIVEKGKTGK